VLTLNELKEKIIEQIDEVDFIDLLNLTTEDLVNAFEDKVLDNIDRITEELYLALDEEETELTD
jgi:phage terminase small subunit